MSRQGVQIAVGAVLAAALLGWYGAGLYDSGALAYYQTLEDFRSAGTGRPSRVHGYVAPGSIERDVPGRQVRFLLQGAPPHASAPAKAANALAVAFAGLDVPDLFGPGAEVVVEGRLTAGGAFLANNVLAKCPSKFESAPAGAGAGAGDARAAR